MKELQSVNEKHKMHNSGIFYGKYKSNRAVNLINIVLNSDFIYIFLILLCAISFIFSAELIVYTIFILLIITIVAIGEKTERLLVVFPFFYIAPSVVQNPALYETSIFLNTKYIVYLLSLSSVAVLLIVILTVKCAVATDKATPNLFKGYLLLCIGYLCSGLLSTGRSWNNTFFALIQIVSVCAFYFIVYYIYYPTPEGHAMWAKTGVSVGITLLIEITCIYLFSGVFDGGYLNRKAIFTGWGIHNNLGNMLCICIPCAFYLMTISKKKVLWLLYACVLMCSVVATTSRSSIIVGCLLFGISLLIFITQARNTAMVKFIVFLCVMFFLLIVILGALIIIQSTWAKESVVKLLNAGIFNDLGRVDAWRKGLGQFWDNPLFGKGFFMCEAYQFGNNPNGNLPARWHNTIVQLLASCGIVGFIAYTFHRIQTIRLFWKNRSIENYFIALSILAILIGSLTDNHFFNIGPGIIYGMFLAFAEKNSSEIVDAPVSI